MSPRGMNQKNKRSFLTLHEKKRVLDEVNNELSYSQIMNRVPFKVSKGQISAIVKNKENIVAEHNSRRCVDHKKTLQPRHPEINNDVNLLVTWLRDQRIPVSPSIITHHARLSAEKHQIAGFKASRGWLKKFLRRNNIQSSRRLHGKAGDIDEVAAESRMSKIRHLMQQFEPRNIYNEDETGLLYRMIPTRTYLSQAEESQTVRGTSQMRRKERITAVLCTNMDGSHKLPVVYIGRSKNPCCMQHNEHLKSRYFSQFNA